jgi:hypothetical protein
VLSPAKRIGRETRTSRRDKAAPSPASPCRTAQIGREFKVRVRTDRDDRFYYRDLLVSCAPQEPNAYYTEAPVLIAEVLSAATERHDRAEKFYRYRKLDSLQESRRGLERGGVSARIVAPQRCLLHFAHG